MHYASVTNSRISAMLSDAMCAFIQLKRWSLGWIRQNLAGGFQAGCGGGMVA